jgi:ligand-binding SRPBCC domain-containing protein
MIRRESLENFGPEMKNYMLHKIETKQILNSDINTVWEFMRDPQNLSRITPSYMGFNVLTSLQGAKMYPGQIIEYTVKPLLGIPLRWVTEITHVQEKEFFVDEQRFGPYVFWHHKHFMKAVENGVEMYDLVHYRLPLGFIGRIANKLFIEKQLKEIFDYRFKVLDQLFNKKTD